MRPGPLVALVLALGAAPAAAEPVAGERPRVERARPADPLREARRAAHGGNSWDAIQLLVDRSSALVDHGSAAERTHFFRAALGVAEEVARHAEPDNGLKAHANAIRIHAIARAVADGAGLDPAEIANRTAASQVRVAASLYDHSDAKRPAAVLAATIEHEVAAGRIALDRASAIQLADLARRIGPEAMASARALVAQLRGE